MPDITVTLLIIVTPLAGLAWYAWTLSGACQRRKKSALLEKLRSSNRFRGITIRNGKCTAVRHFTGNFYHFSEAPALPVEGCKALRCSCVYAGLNNRRYQSRRGGRDHRSAIRLEADHPDRRERKDRRKGNNIKWQDPAD
jgi:hypothetical protein